MNATVRSWLCDRLEEGVARQIDRVAGQPDVWRMAVMPDVHQGRTIPNGIAVATRRLVYPDLVGADIGCGISAIRFHAAAHDLDRTTLEAVLDRLGSAVPTLKQPPARAAANLSAVAALGPLSCDRLGRAAARDGVYQLGTLGRGNHFVELARADDGSLWAVVHTGSRAMGQEITSHHLSTLPEAGVDAAGPGESAAAPLFSLDTSTMAGQAYFSDMQWACRYAAANRAMILNAVADLLEARRGVAIDAESFIDSPHNMATHEECEGEVVIVHRKSANHAPAAGPGIVAGSMASGSRITIGMGNPGALASSAHGAGRVMSRSVAGQRILARDLESRMGGIVFRREWAGRFRDEAPQAYRDLREVMQAQRELVRTTATLLPILNDKRP